MPPVNRLIASTLLGVGVVLVFAGYSAALGFTALGVLASLAAIVTLMYAGATWFPKSAPAVADTSPPIPLVVFDRSRRIIGGDAAGELLELQFPEILRGEVQRHCVAALNGASTRFPCLQNGRMVVFEALPVRAADGSIIYGILIRSSAEPAAIAATA